MKDEETIARFIHPLPRHNRMKAGRADGWSFARIATELNVSKPTLIDWGRQFQFEIQNLRSVETEALPVTGENNGSSGQDLCFLRYLLFNSSSSVSISG